MTNTANSAEAIAAPGAPTSPDRSVSDDALASGGPAGDGGFDPSKPFTTRDGRTVGNRFIDKYRPDLIFGTIDGVGGAWKRSTGVYEGKKSAVNPALDLINTPIPTVSPTPAGDGGLLPCPFCGGSAKTIRGETTLETWPRGSFSRAYCTECQTRQLFYKDDAAAIEAWNHRVEPTPAGDMAGEDDISITDEMLNAAQERLCDLRSSTYFDDYLFAEMYKAARAAEPAREGAQRDPSVAKPNGCTCALAPQWIASKAEGAPRICANCGRDEIVGEREPMAKDDAIFKLLDDLDDLFDKQTFDERRKADFDNHPDDEFSVNVTAGLMKRVGAILNKRARERARAPSPASPTPTPLEEALCRTLMRIEGRAAYADRTGDFYDCGLDKSLPAWRAKLWMAREILAAHPVLGATGLHVALDLVSAERQAILDRPDLDEKLRAHAVGLFLAKKVIKRALNSSLERLELAAHEPVACENGHTWRGSDGTTYDAICVKCGLTDRQEAEQRKTQIKAASPDDFEHAVITGQIRKVYDLECSAFLKSIDGILHDLEETGVGDVKVAHGLMNQLAERLIDNEIRLAASSDGAGSGSEPMAAFSEVERQVIRVACEPWSFHHGAPPDDDSPLSGVFGAGMAYAEKLLASVLGVKQYEGGDGSEDFDCDATKTLTNILAEAGIWDKDECCPKSAAVAFSVDAVAVVTDVMVDAAWKEWDARADAGQIYRTQMREVILAALHARQQATEAGR